MTTVARRTRDRVVRLTSGHGVSRLAWSLWVLVMALTGSSLILLALNLSHPGTHVFDWWLGNAMVVVDATVGAIVASRRPENPVGWLLCLSGVVVSTSSFASQYAIYALLAQPASLPAGEAAAWVGAWQLPIIIGLQISYLLLFPTGRLPSRRWRWLSWLTAAFVAVGVILSAFSADAYLGALGPIRNPLGIEGFTGAYEALLYTMAPVLFIGAALSVFVRLLGARGIERQQIKWFAYAAAAWSVGIVLNVLTLAADAPPWFEVGGQVFFAVTGAAIPIAIGIAILRHHLYDIDLIINRTLVYGSLTAMLAGVYVGSIVALQEVLRAPTGQESQFAIVVSTLAVAALFNPLRRRMQIFIDHRFYRRKYDARKMLEAFSITLRDETDLELLNTELVALMRGTMQPAHVSLWLRSDEESPQNRTIRTS